MFPTPWTAGWHTATAGTDAHNNPTNTTHTPELVDDDNNPVDGTPVKVMCWAPAESVEPGINQVVYDLDLYCPPGTVVNPDDVVDLPLDRSVGRFEVVGWPKDFTKGPFGFTPGMVVQLRRAEG
jgi:hypothetical protein